LIAAHVASAFVAVPMAVTPSAADEQFAPTAVVQLPDGQILSAFDISFVSAENRTLAVAASRVVAAHFAHPEADAGKLPTGRTSDLDGSAEAVRNLSPFGLRLLRRCNQSGSGLCRGAVGKHRRGQGSFRNAQVIAEHALEHGA
jgi:hypothetical protein